MNGPAWYFSQAGKREGPVDLDTLVRRLTTMSSPGDILVWREGLSNWTSAHDVPEIAARLPPPLPPKAHGPTASSRPTAGSLHLPSVAVLVVSGILLMWGLLPLMNGQLNLGPALAGLLYLAFGIALLQDHPVARARLWSLAAFPVVVTPIGFLIFIGTVALTVRLRKGSATGSSRPSQGGGVVSEPKEGASKTCPECGQRARFSRQTRVPGSDAAFVGHGGAIPEPLPPCPTKKGFVSRAAATNPGLTNPLAADGGG